jgi:hypothetical protein
MYSTCISCYRDLGTNDVAPRLPVGRVLAFDSERGRLWVVCQHCRRWNLLPLEERWEAMEDALRAFGAARRRTSTGQVSLAMAADGTALVHIGRASLPEFAAWRYGQQLVARWTRGWRAADVELASAGIGSLTALATTAAAAGLGLGALSLAAPLLGVPAGLVGWSHLSQRRRERPLCWVWSESGQPVPVTVAGGSTAELITNPEADDDWAVTLVDFDGRRRYSGSVGWRVLAAALAYQNRFGASARVVESAVGHIEHVGASELFMQRQAARPPASVAVLPRPMRLALEISLHEVAERRAQDGDLAGLEAEWREAEQIAQIADDLLVPGHVSERLDRLRRAARR